MNRPSTLLLLMVAAWATWGTGCSPTVRWPNLFHPGPAGFQRAVAEKYDPYPSPDAGPEIVGGRPLGYQRPLNDAEWGRRFGRPNGAAQPVRLPTLAPTVTTAPPAPMPIAPSSPSPAPFGHMQSPY